MRQKPLPTGGCEAFATEGGRAAIRWAFENLDIERLSSVIHPDNAASIRVAEKLGERFLREHEINGARVLIFAIERRDFKEPAIG